MTAPTPRQMIDQLADANEETMLLADGFDDAILGLHHAQLHGYADGQRHSLGLPRTLAVALAHGQQCADPDVLV